MDKEQDSARMEYDVKLRIDYRYAGQAVGGRHLVCLMPLSVGSGQTVSAARLTISPTPQERTDRRDFFGNQVSEFSIHAPHDRLTLEMTARVVRQVGTGSATGAGYDIGNGSAHGAGTGAGTGFGAGSAHGAGNDIGNGSAHGGTGAGTSIGNGSANGAGTGIGTGSANGAGTGIATGIGTGAGIWQGAADLPLIQMPSALSQIRDVGPQSGLHFLSPSTRVPRDPEIIGFARDLAHDLAGSQVGAQAGTLATVLAIGRALHGHMTFDASATTVDTPAAEAFAKARGVCQDFSHIMIAALRGLGIPAGYVSGFLRTQPPPGKPRLEGADAMHAWVMVWCGPGLGWIEYDPTNACFAGNDHIVVARGRDYSDVAPVKGTMRIAGGQKSRQAVDVVPVLPQNPAPLGSKGRKA